MNEALVAVSSEDFFDFGFGSQLDYFQSLVAFLEVSFRRFEFSLKVLQVGLAQVTAQESLLDKLWGLVKFKLKV